MILSSYFYSDFFRHKLEHPQQDIELQEKEEETDSSYIRKETVDVELLIAYKNTDRKIMQLIKIERSIQINICQRNA